MLKFGKNLYKALSFVQFLQVFPGSLVTNNFPPLLAQQKQAQFVNFLKQHKL